MSGSIAISLTKLLRDEYTIICTVRGPGMRDLLLSTEHPLYSARFHGMPPAAGNLFKFAHLSRDDSSTLGSHDSKLSIDESRRESHYRSDRHQIFIAITVLQSV